jgi:hypothetical protein
VSEFWRLASESRQQYLDFVEAGFAPETVRLFDWGMRMVEINDVVEKEADNPRTLGRAFTTGVSNMGVYAPQEPNYGQSASHTVSHSSQSVIQSLTHSLTHSLTKPVSHPVHQPLVQVLVLLG